MIVKGLIVLIFLFIVFSLFFALYTMAKDKSRTNRTVKALTVRIAGSIALLIFLMIMYKAGYITPHNVYNPSAQQMPVK